MTKDDLSSPDEDYVTLTVANDDYEASLIAGRLREGGVASRVAKRPDAIGGFIYKGYDPSAPAAVLIAEKDLAKAKELLENADWTFPPDRVIQQMTHQEDSDLGSSLENLRTLRRLVIFILALTLFAAVGWEALDALWNALTG